MIHIYHHKECYCQSVCVGIWTWSLHTVSCHSTVVLRVTVIRRVVDHIDGEEVGSRVTSVRYCDLQGVV